MADSEKVSLETRIENFFRSADKVWKEWTAFHYDLRVSNGFVCSLFLLVGLEATLFMSNVVQDPVSKFEVNPLLGHPLSGVVFGVILTVFTQFSMMLGSHVIRYSLNDLAGVIGYGIGVLLLSILAIPTILISPELYNLLLVEIFVSMMLLVARITIWTMPRIRIGAVS